MRPELALRIDRGCHSFTGRVERDTEPVAAGGKNNSVSGQDDLAEPPWV